MTKNEEKDLKNLLNWAVNTYNKNHTVDVDFQDCVKVLRTVFGEPEYSGVCREHVSGNVYILKK